MKFGACALSEPFFISQRPRGVGDGCICHNCRAQEELLQIQVDRGLDEDDEDLI